MTKKLLFCVALLSAVSGTALAGGILTNTNQNVAFLRNPARDGAIGIDGIYSNPAGVAFMDEGTHLSINWQAAWQTRTIETTNPVFTMSKDFNGQPQHYEGKASAPFLPSVQAAYNKGKWSLQFNFSVTGGGGKCEFANGLGSFEGAVGQIAAGLNQFGVMAGLPNPIICNGYDCNSYMQGKQYYFGFTMGAAYKVTDNFSVYGGIRVLYGSATYKAKIDNIKVITDATPEGEDFGQYYDRLKPYIDAAAQVSPAAKKLQAVESYREGVNLQSDQSGVGFAPILGADLKLDKFNFAVKYEFRTKMNMENKSTVKEAHAIDAVNVFRDGTSIREDQPSLLAFGVQYTPVECVRINAGYHHFYDKAAKKTYYKMNEAGVSTRYDNKNDMLANGTNEYLGGAEWDITKKLTASAGFQITRYGNTDEYINDISFVVDSWSYGLGVKYKVTDKIAINAAYFKTCYDDYTTAVDANGVQNSFTRSNRVGAIGVDIKF
ncbi:MAG: transporter [Prevotella sp.]|nr:transporter [Prevotella sp.]